MTPLRKKMIRAMELRNLSHHTQRSYLTAVKGLSRHYQNSPDKLTKEMIEDYLLYCIAWLLAELCLRIGHDGSHATATCSTKRPCRWSFAASSWSR